MSNSEEPLWQVHQRFMAQAVMLAEQAFEEGEVPVGAIVVHENSIVGKGYNQVERLNDPTAHAEMLAISAACDTLGEKYLGDCTLYVTLEPCPMCSGALVWSKIGRIVFGATDPKAGGSGSVFNITQNKHLNHEAEVIQGVLEQDCEYLLKSFFASRRMKF
jgi:tRNA(adenine34) deaminase